ncbi:MAG: hypothetical protein D6800_15090, partial [Candidatus Zixiibacteriota bacterium]
IAEWYLESSAKVSFFFGDIPEGTYELAVTASPDRPQMTFPSVDISRPDDRQPPEVLEFSPTAPSVFAGEADLWLAFSEPIDTTRLRDNSLVLWRDDTAAVPLTRQWSGPMALHLLPEKLIPGARYRLDLTAFDFLDLAGNALGDSLRSYSFLLYNDDSLGTISGHVAVELPDRRSAPVVLTFRRVPRGRSFDLSTDSPVFRIDVPAGKYLLSGFVDSNRDGHYTPGTLHPWRLSETRAEYADTIQVRARFETAGIELTFE